MKSVSSNSVDLKAAPYEIQKQFCGQVEKEIENFLSIKYPGHVWDMRSQLFDVLLKSKYDHQAELWDMRYTCMDLLTALAHPEISKAFKGSTVIDAADLLQRLVEFFSVLQDNDKIKAELDMEMLKGWGTDNIGVSINLHHEYAKKTKLAIYEKQLEEERVLAA